MRPRAKLAVMNMLVFSTLEYPTKSNMFSEWLGVGNYANKILNSFVRRECAYPIQRKIRLLPATATYVKRKARLGPETTLLH